LRRFRENQAKRRVEEIKEGVELLKTLNAGVADGSQFYFGADMIPLLKGRVDLENMIMAGHSFGGATGFAILQEPDTPFIAGVLLDPWMYTVPQHLSLQRPILTLQAEFFHWKCRSDFPPTSISST
jgi:platelet-activating factor acetylhydrolase